MVSSILISYKIYTIYGLHDLWFTSRMVYMIYALYDLWLIWFMINTISEVWIRWLMNCMHYKSYDLCFIGFMIHMSFDLFDPYHHTMVPWCPGNIVPWYQTGGYHRGYDNGYNCPRRAPFRDSKSSFRLRKLAFRIRRISLRIKKTCNSDFES